MTKSKKLFTLIIASFISIVTMAGCAKEAVLEPPPVAPSLSVAPSVEMVIPPALLAISPDDYPKVDGSTATIPLGEAMAAVLTGQDRAVCGACADFSGTDSAWRNLATGDADLIIAYEPATGAIAEDIEYKPIGSDALVFLVNKANPIDSLTLREVQKIYTGEITNWAEVGGDDAPITAFSRNEKAGSYVMFNKLVMDGLNTMPPPQDFIIDGMMGLLTAVAEFDSGRYAIGYNVYFYVTVMTNYENIKIISIDGVAPTKETISGGSYKLVNNFFAAINKNAPSDSPARKVFDWLSGDEAKRLIEREGYLLVAG